jgi:septum formation topological specificity factor MinE
VVYSYCSKERTERKELKMSIVDELRAESDKLTATTEKIKKEILEYFRKYIGSEEFVNYIRRNADMQKKRLSVEVEWWEYVPGCTETHWRVGNKDWKLNKDEDYDKRYNMKYKGIDMHKIQNELGSEIYYMVEDEMKKLGFYWVSTVNKSGQLNLYRKEQVYTW